MKKSLYNAGSALRSLIPSILVFAAVMAMVIYGLGSAETAVFDEGLKAAEESVRRAVITCYSIESRYPQSYEYLAENYGLNVDLERYAVHYEIFASNIMPSVTVVRR